MSMNRENMHNRVMRLMLAALLMLCALAPRADVVSEYQVKAGFIYNIARFTQWPGDLKTIRICIYGDDPFGSYIDSIDGKAVGDRNIEITRTRSIRAIKDCNIAFLNIIPPEERLFARALRELEGSKVLTIADFSEAVRYGVVVGFLIDEDRVGFNINHTVAKSTKLEISAKVLRLAREVI